MQYIANNINNLHDHQHVNYRAELGKKEAYRICSVPDYFYVFH